MKHRFFYLLLPFLFAGCAQLPDNQPAQKTTWAMQQPQLEALTHWSFTGKLAVLTPEQRNSVNIHWQQSNQDFSIHLTTFLGLRVLDITKVGDETLVVDNEGKHYRSNNSEQLISELSGMVLPIAQLQEWIKGNPHQASYQLNEWQQVSQLLGGSQDSVRWTIAYNDYRLVDNINLPHRLLLTRGDLRLKFAISTWYITP